MGAGACVYLSIGSNLGDKYRNCLRGIDCLGEQASIKILDVSGFYRTAPVDYTAQDWFINGALSIETGLKPDQLLKTLKQVEQALGQFSKEIRFGPRIIDLDIIFYDTVVLENDELIIPHPRMHKRCFVLKPLCDIGADIMHPILKKTVRQLLSTIENDPDQQVYDYHPGEQL